MHEQICSVLQTTVRDLKTAQRCLMAWRLLRFGLGLVDSSLVSCDRRQSLRGVSTSAPMKFSCHASSPIKLQSQAALSVIRAAFWFQILLLFALFSIMRVCLRVWQEESVTHPTEYEPRWIQNGRLCYISTTKVRIQIANKLIILNNVIHDLKSAVNERVEHTSTCMYIHVHTCTYVCWCSTK